MKISKDLADKMLDLNLQIKHKFGIGIAYSHPCGFFAKDDDDFIIIQDGVVSAADRDIDYGDAYIVEYNTFKVQHYGIFATTEDFYKEQETEKLTNFLIDFHKWLSSGEIKIEEWRTVENYKWKPSGDGRYDVEEDHGSHKYGYLRELDQLPQIVKDAVWREQELTTPS